MRKVLDLPFSQHKTKIFQTVSIILLIGSLVATYMACNELDRSFGDSWVSCIGETAIAGAIFVL